MLFKLKDDVDSFEIICIWQLQLISLGVVIFVDSCNFEAPFNL
jgi:hypothetical protein